MLQAAAKERVLGHQTSHRSARRSVTGQDTSALLAPQRTRPEQSSTGPSRICTRTKVGSTVCAMRRRILSSGPGGSPRQGGRNPGSASSSPPSGQCWSCSVAMGAALGVHWAKRMMHHRCNGHADGLLFMSPPWRHLPLSATPCDSTTLRSKLSFRCATRVKIRVTNLSEPGCCGMWVLWGVVGGCGDGGVVGLWDCGIVKMWGCWMLVVAVLVAVLVC